MFTRSLGELPLISEYSFITLCWQNCVCHTCSYISPSLEIFKTRLDKVLCSLL